MVGAEGGNGCWHILPASRLGGTGDLRASRTRRPLSRPPTSTYAPPRPPTSRPPTPPSSSIPQGVAGSGALADRRSALGGGDADAARQRSRASLPLEGWLAERLRGVPGGEALVIYLSSFFLILPPPSLAPSPRRLSCREAASGLQPGPVACRHMGTHSRLLARLF